MTEQHNDKEAFYEKIIGFFDQQVLASYRSEPNKYILKTDYFEGRLRTADDDESAVATDHINVRFGYHMCASGDLALAIYLPDLFERSSAHVQRWAGFHLEGSKLTTEPDGRFALWKARYLEGSWSIENGPRDHLENIVTVINALCIEVVGQVLFKFSNNPVLNFPAAQNTHAYQDAHRELYGYIMDGFDMETIKRIAVHQGLTLKGDSDRTLKALKKALPTLLPDSVLWQALNKVSSKRREAGHGVRLPAQRFQAFEEFTKDLEAVVTPTRCATR